MNLDRFQALLDAYGADPARWPGGERQAALSLVRESAACRQRLAAALALDRLLDDPALARAAERARPALEAGALARAIAATPHRRGGSLAAAAPGWRIAVGWPNFAGLAAAAAAGFIVGWFGLAGGLGIEREAADLMLGLSSEEESPW
ncbi:MAG: hypothetical protein ACT4P2_08190 [Pseudomonadota bacterium]